MKKLTYLALLLIAGFSSAARQHPAANYDVIKTGNVVQSKNYYLLTLMQQLPQVNQLISADKLLSEIGISKKKILRSTIQDCGSNVSCYLSSLKFSEEEIQTVGERLKTLYSTRNELKELVANQLVPSGKYILYGGLGPENLLTKAWEQDARAVNYAIDVYAGGESPNYPKIDSISFNVGQKAYSTLLHDYGNTVLEGNKDEKLFFKPVMDYALLVLEANDRNRAADYEPMESGANRQAIERIKHINWSDFPYSVILVPGAGPDDPQEALSAVGMLRCKVAAYRWREKKAPFIIVSGGKVHPYKTKFCEAEEMKRYLMEIMKVPEESIIIEPHARHTSTNMRNCARLIFQYGMPMDKPAITSTTKSQSYYITDDVMQQRCIKELGYSPYRNGRRLSETEAEFYPLINSLQIDGDEPMDP